VACLGSRLFTGVLAPERALGLTDRQGVSLARVLTAAGGSPDDVGPWPRRLAQLGSYVELHIEQGCGLAELDAPVGVASVIWPHGRWRVEITGTPNHAGTTAMDDRNDPMVTFAHLVITARRVAIDTGARATVGRVSVEPNATNAVAAQVTGWLDARAPDQSTLDALVSTVQSSSTAQSMVDGTSVTWTTESASPVTVFDPGLRDRLVRVLGGPPVLPTGAGHDAAVLAEAGVAAAMLFVRNPTGVSHAPDEQASDADCAAGVEALTEVLAELACR
jgi:N-carbamoyl-L-amino-acid hydrolase